MTGKIEPFYEDVGRRVREGRNKLGMTQEQLGRAMSPPITRVSVANIEAGKQRILSHSLVQFSVVLNVEITQLLPTKNSPPTNHTLAKELVSKLGISKSKAEKFLAKAKN